KAKRPPGVYYGFKEAPAKQKGAVRLAAYNVENLFDGEDDPKLSGEVDDLKERTSEDRLQALAKAIKALDADILALEEVESEECLRWFRDTYLKDLGYEHVASKDVGYSRGVEQSILSRFPIESVEVRPEEDLSDVKRDGKGFAEKPTKPGAEQGQRFQRSPLIADVRVTPDYLLRVIVVHHKAGGLEFAYQREAEALQVVEWVKEAQAKDEHINLVVLGDFNAQPSHKTAKIYAEGGLVGAYDFRDRSRKDMKDAYTTHASGRPIDYIMASPGLSEDFVNSSFFVLGTMHAGDDYDWRKGEEPPKGYASDHYPIAIDFTPDDAELTDCGKAKPAGKGAPKSSAKSSSKPASKPDADDD
ncbi:MAG: endonuclease/exonuclease/phosphatase family protein, partial [Planctomycetota bacterium]